MIGLEFTTTDAYTDDSTIGPQGYPVQVVLDIDHPVFMQVAFRPFPRISNRVRWDFTDVAVPAGQFRMRRVHGLRFKTRDSTPATISYIVAYKEDPEFQSFSFD